MNPITFAGCREIVSLRKNYWRTTPQESPEEKKKLLGQVSLWKEGKLMGKPVGVIVESAGNPSKLLFLDGRQASRYWELVLQDRLSNNIATIFAKVKKNSKRYQELAKQYGMSGDEVEALKKQAPIVAQNRKDYLVRTEKKFLCGTEKPEKVEVLYEVNRNKTSRNKSAYPQLRLPAVRIVGINTVV